jgi:signal transduction histidine kinase
MSLDDDVQPSPADQQDFERAASLAAHEMAGPLSTATAAVDLLRTRLDDDATASELVAIAARHLRIARLQTSRLAQLASGPRAPEPVRTDLAALAREVVDDLALSELVHHPTAVESDGPVHAPVDPDQIRQTLYNLLTNAANYSPRGREIVIGISQEPDRVLLRVRDQGHGVAPESIERIFEPYQRGHDEAPGLGLGLALSRGIARSHGGDLTFEPAPRGGAVFLLTLPRRGTTSI